MRPFLTWTGGFHQTHSLAHVNRELCLGVKRSEKFNMTLNPLPPMEFSLRHYFWELCELPFDPENPYQAPDVTVRHHWPTNWAPLEPGQGKLVVMQPWEYGGVPMEWVKYAEKVDEIWVYTPWNRDNYISTGVPEEKVKVIPLGVRLQEFLPHGPKFPLRTQKKFKIFFQGGLILRKGIDLMVDAYHAAFTSHDDVCLVIKGQPGAIYLQPEPPAFHFPGGPEIEVVNQCLTVKEMTFLHRACDVFALPYRGEGFGLPIAEAMASGLAVIVPSRGAAREFTSGPWATLVPCARKYISVPDVTRPPGGFWVEECHVDDLATALRHAYDNPEDMKAKGRLARAHAELHLGWEHGVRAAVERLEALTEK